MFSKMFAEKSLTFFSSTGLYDLHIITLVKMEAEVLALKWNNHQSIFYHIISGLRTKVCLPSVSFSFALSVDFYYFKCFVYLISFPYLYLEIDDLTYY